MKLAFFFLFAALALVAAKPPPTPHHPAPHHPAPHHPAPHHPAPHHPDHEIKILKSAFDLDPVGSYRFGFETENHITREEVGEIKVVKNEKGKEEPVVVVKGSYSYQDPEGHPITVVFFADETGFHPEGAHLPVA